MTAAEWFRPSGSGERMKVGQQAMVRWMSKLVAKSAGRSDNKAAALELRELSADQQRQVGGGNGGSLQLPKVGGW
jgi:hypothetical protein